MNPEMVRLMPTDDDTVDMDQVVKDKEVVENDDTDIADDSDEDDDDDDSDIADDVEDDAVEGSDK